MSVGHHHYEDITVTSTEFGDDCDKVILPWIAHSILLVSDSMKDNIKFSFNNRDICGELRWDDEKLTMSGIETNKLFLVTDNPSGTSIRVYCEA